MTHQHVEILFYSSACGGHTRTVSAKFFHNWVTYFSEKRRTKEKNARRMVGTKSGSVEGEWKISRKTIHEWPPALIRRSWFCCFKNRYFGKTFGKPVWNIASCWYSKPLLDDSLNFIEKDFGHSITARFLFYLPLWKVKKHIEPTSGFEPASL